MEKTQAVKLASVPPQFLCEDCKGEVKQATKKASIQEPSGIKLSKKAERKLVSKIVKALRNPKAYDAKQLARKKKKAAEEFEKTAAQKPVVEKKVATKKAEPDKRVDEMKALSYLFTEDSTDTTELDKLLK